MREIFRGKTFEEIVAEMNEAVKNSTGEMTEEEEIEDDAEGGYFQEEDCCFECDYDSDEIPSYYQTITSFPVCNHTQCVSEDNLGFVQGIIKEGIPFEAELWKNETSVNISVVLPKQFEPSQNKNNPLISDNLMGFRQHVRIFHNGILTIGMVDDGFEEDYNVIIQYVDYLKDNALVEFIGNMENGLVLYATDVEGKSVAYVTVTLSEQGERFAETTLCFMDFPTKPKKKTLSLVK